MGKWELVKLVKLGDVCEGKSSNIAQKDLVGNEGLYPIYGASGLIKNVDFYKYEQEYIAVIKDGAGIGRTIMCEAKSSVIGTMQALIPNESIDYRYMFYAVSRMGLSKYYTGATIPHIYFKDYKDEKILLPPVDIQKKITAALDTANALIEKRKEQIEKLDLLIKSQFIEMFGDPVTNPKGWEIKRLGALTNKITDGVHQKPIYTTYGVPFISVANINKGVLNFDDCKFVSEEDYLKMTKSVKPEQGDILYTKVGATYGIPAFIDTDKRFCLYVSVCLIKPISELINARFLAISMSMPYIKRQADERIRGIGVPDLHLNQISEFNICVPKRVEQEEFVQFVEQVETQKALLKKSLADMEQNYQSLLQKCFKGEIF